MCWCCKRRPNAKVDPDGDATCPDGDQNDLMGVVPGPLTPMTKPFMRPAGEAVDGGPSQSPSLCSRQSVESLAAHLTAANLTVLSALPSDGPATSGSILVAPSTSLGSSSSSVFKSGSMISNLSAMSSLLAAPLGLASRNSQMGYFERDQTAIIFDWDDTLFPTTYIQHDMQFAPRKPLKEQQIKEDVRKEVQTQLAHCASSARQLLSLAAEVGQVVIVTLSKSPWVRDSIRNFYPGMWEFLTQLKVKVVYADRGSTVPDTRTMAPEDVEMFWSKCKGLTIGKELRRIYSQYEGQSWKNVISIGDSDFERLGTMTATEEYMREVGIIKTAPVAGRDKDGEWLAGTALTREGEVSGHTFKVRTKTFKMISQPTVEELKVEIDICKQWLPLMVRFDHGFDIDLGGLQNSDDIRSVEAKLHGDKEFGSDRTGFDSGHT